MSSIDQAFIKAFARRNRPSQPATATTPQSVATPRTSNVDDRPDSSKSHHSKNKTRLENDFLRIASSVHSSVEVWTDPSEDRLVRVDALRSDPVPPPHAAATTRTTKPDASGQSANASIGGAHATPPASNPLVDLPTQIEKTAEPALSVQDSLSLLQRSITTLEAFTQPADDIATIYGTNVATTSPTKRAQPATESETPSSSGHESEPPEVVQRRIDIPTESSVTPEITPNGESESTEDDFGLTGAPPESLYMRPVWEVDVFDVPTAVADLFFDGPLFQQIAERVLQAVNSGLSSMMVTSVHRGEGRSTVAIGMAMAAAAAGLRVALIDADTEDPSLQDDLRLDLEYGWVDTVRGGLAIREVAVHAVEDGVTLIPLMPPIAGAAATDFEIVQVLQSLRGKFDLIVVDTPSLESSSTLPAATIIDSALIVRDASRTDADKINTLSYQLREKGVQGIGIIDNFA